MKRRWRWRDGWYWLLALGGLGLLAWVLWRTARSLEPRPGPALPSAPAPVPPVPTRVAPTPPPVTVLTNLAPARPPTVTSPTLTPPLLEPTHRPVRNVLEAQIALASLGISSGSIDGVLGFQTRAALRAYQTEARIPVTGFLDAVTRQHLRLSASVLTTYTVTSNDIARLLPVGPTWLGKSWQPRLDFENILELVAETSRSHPGLIRRLNPDLDWSIVTSGASVTVPNVVPPTAAARAAAVHIHLAVKTLEAFDADTNLIAHFPCSIARLVEKRPVGMLTVVGVVHQPNYTFNPELFPESAEGRRLGRKLVLPPGPNNPVGTAWIGLDHPGYGIHGTPHPEEVGRTESHGCFRLANWDAEFLAQMVNVGTSVYIEP